MSGFIPIEMYLALAEELKAYKDKNQFLEKEIKQLREKNQELTVDSMKTDEQMELVYAQYKTHAEQNRFLKSELQKLRTDRLILPMSLTPSMTSLSPSTELPVLEELSITSSPEENLVKTTEREVLAIEAPACEPIFESVSDEPLNETIWCGPEPGSVDVLDDEPHEYILEEVPTRLPSSVLQTKKTSVAEKKTKNQNKRPKLIKALSVPAKKMKLEVDQQPVGFACRLSPCEYTSFKSLDDHRDHLKTNHSDKPLLCSRCPYAANKKSLICSHEKIHEKNEMAYRETQKGVFCELCGITFARGTTGRHKSELRKHNNQFH